MTQTYGRAIVAAAVAIGSISAVLAQERPVSAQAAPSQPVQGRGRGAQGPAVVSPDVLPDRRVVLRILAPDAATVGLRAGDIPGLGQSPAQFTKGENGVWEATVGPIPPGAYRYTFTVNGVAVLDPRNPSVSQSNTTAWSLFDVPGSAEMDTANVPHGAVASVNYLSTALGRNRRMHVYTPPGYEAGQQKYPVFYLLHGAGDSDDSWTSVGRAGFILDNLIAAKKAKPMVVVMPAGHTSASGGGGRGAAAGGRDEFAEDFVQDILPYIEKNYRVVADRAHRAMAGLSMGGSQTLNIAIPHLDKFAYVGVYSSGLLGAFGRGAAPAAAATPGTTWEQQHLAELDNPALKKGLKLIWFSTGVDDSLMPTTKGTVDLLKKHGFSPVFLESPGGHTWLNWRNYLTEFAPQLFQ